MTPANALAEPQPATVTNWPSSGGFVMNMIVTLLAPIFLSMVGGDIGLARMAAAETLEDYRLRTQLDPIAVGQIVLNGLAALDSVSRSMADDLSLEMVLRLRCNGIGLNRVAEQNRRVRRGTQPADAASFTTVSLPEPLAVVAESVLPAEPDVEPPAPHPADPVPACDATPPPMPEATGEKQQRRIQVMTMVKEVAELKASLRTLPQAEHQDIMTRIAVLDSSVYALLTGPRPADPLETVSYASE